MSSSSADVIHPVQLKLFMTGKELRDSIDFSYDTFVEHGETLDEMWDRKLRESMSIPGIGRHGAGTYDSILTQGWNPNRYEDGTIHMRFAKNKQSQRIEDGHHRVASAAAIEEATGKPTFIPMSYSDDYEDATHSFPSSWRVRSSSW